jgi:hypothetical protein
MFGYSQQLETAALLQYMIKMLGKSQQLETAALSQYTIKMSRHSQQLETAFSIAVHDQNILDTANSKKCKPPSLMHRCAQFFKARS